MSIFATKNLIFDEIFNNLQTDKSFMTYYSDKGRRPLYSTPKEFSVEIPFSGLSKDEVKVSVEGNVLMIKTEVTKESGFVLNHRDKSYSYSLTEAHDLDKIEAKMENGLLSIKVPVKEEMQKPNFEVEIV